MDNNINQNYNNMNDYIDYNDDYMYYVNDTLKVYHFDTE